MPRITERDVPVILNRFDRRMGDVERRVRALEDSVKALETNLDGLSEDLFDKDKTNKKALDEIRRQGVDLTDKRLTEIESQIKEVVRLIGMKADKSDIVAVKETMEMYDPIKSQFVTKGEIERMLGKGSKGKPPPLT